MHAVFPDGTVRRREVADAAHLRRALEGVGQLGSIILGLIHLDGLPLTFSPDDAALVAELVEQVYEHPDYEWTPIGETALRSLGDVMRAATSGVTLQTT